MPAYPCRTGQQLRGTGTEAAAAQSPGPAARAEPGPTVRRAAAAAGPGRRLRRDCLGHGVRARSAEPWAGGPVAAAANNRRRRRLDT